MARRSRISKARAAELPPDVCPSCGASREHLYCARCGERRRSPHDHSVGAFVEHSIEGLSHLDGKLFQTLRDLTRPGRFTAEVLRGARVKRMKPLQVFLVANLVYFFVQPYTLWNTFTTPYSWHLTNPYRKIAQALGEKRMRERGLDLEQFTEAFDHAALARAKLLIIALIPIVAATLALIHRRRPFGEHLVLAAEYMTFNLIVQGMLLAFAVRGLFAIAPSSLARALDAGSDTVLSAVVSAIVWTFFALAFRRVFAEPWRAAIPRAFLAMVGYWFAIYLYRALLFFVTYATT